MLLHQPMPEEKKTQGIFKTTVRLQLTKQALTKPYFAWKTVLKAFTGVQPLCVSMHHKGLAEVYWDIKHKETVEKELQERKVIVDPLPPTEQDIPRLTKCYLNGYFQMLRRAPLEALPLQIQEDILLEAERTVNDSFSNYDSQLWMKRIAVDREWIISMSEQDHQEMHHQQLLHQDAPLVTSDAESPLPDSPLLTSDTATLRRQPLILG
jgi:hypothetical protein